MGQFELLYICVFLFVFFFLCFFIVIEKKKKILKDINHEFLGRVLELLIINLFYMKSD